MPATASISDLLNGMPGQLLVISGPSGSGKSTLVSELLKLEEFPIEFSVSATTRPPRNTEKEGRHYRFVSRQQFIEMRDAGEFLEWAEVYGNLYGTPLRPVEEILGRGKWVLLEIDVHGQRQVKERKPEAISFFVRTDSIESYRSRLIGRGSETPDAIERRVADAAMEIRHACEYDFQIVNESVPQAIACFRTLLWGLVALRFFLK